MGINIMTPRKAAVIFKWDNLFTARAQCLQAKQYELLLV